MLPKLSDCMGVSMVTQQQLLVRVEEEQQQLTRAAGETVTSSGPRGEAACTVERVHV